MAQHSVSGFIGSILIAVPVFTYVFSVTVFTLSARLWKDKVTVKSFFNNFLKFRRIAPFAAIFLAVYSAISSAFYFISESLVHSDLIFLFYVALVFVLLVVSVLYYLCLIYAGSTTLKASEIFNVALSKKGALRSIFSLLWCKVKFFFAFLLAELAFAIVAGVVFGVATLVVHALGLAHAAGLHHFYSIAGVCFYIVFWVAFVYWLLPFISLFVMASYGQVVKASIKEYDLPMNPEFLDSDK